MLLWKTMTLQQQSLKNKRPIYFNKRHCSCRRWSGLQLGLIIEDQLVKCYDTAKYNEPLLSQRPRGSTLWASINHHIWDGKSKQGSWGVHTVCENSETDGFTFSHDTLDALFNLCREDCWIIIFFSPQHLRSLLKPGRSQLITKILLSKWMNRGQKICHEFWDPDWIRYEWYSQSVYK